MNDAANRSDDLRSGVASEALPSKMRSPIVFESAVDRWLIFLMAMAPATSFFSGIYAWWLGQPDGAAILFVCGAAATLVTAAVAFPCRYTLMADSLSIRFGIMVRQIPLSEIVSVQPTASLRSGPALSLKRIAIQTRKKTTIISPKDREGFLAEIELRGIASPET